jgi:hypothetical protein
MFVATQSNGVYEVEDGVVSVGLTGQNVNALYIIGSTLFAGTNDNVYVGDISHMNTVTWTPATLQGIAVTCFTTNGNVLYAGTNGQGVWEYDLSAATPTWTQIGLTEVNAKAIYFQNNILYVGTPTQIFTYDTAVGEPTWTPVYASEAPVTDFSGTGGSNVIASTLGNGLISSINNGQTWNPYGFSTGLTNPYITFVDAHYLVGVGLQNAGIQLNPMGLNSLGFNFENTNFPQMTGTITAFASTDSDENYLIGTADGNIYLGTFA